MGYATHVGGRVVPVQTPSAAGVCSGVILHCSRLLQISVGGKPQQKRFERSFSKDTSKDWRRILRRETNNRSNEI